MRHFAGKVWAIVRKDLAMELHSREMLSSMFIFALISLLIFSFSFELRVAQLAQVAPGVLWVVFSFTGMLGLSRSFIRERDQGCLDGLLLCPVDRSIIYLGKMLSNLLFMLLTEAIVLPIFFVLLDVPFHPLLLLVIVLGTLGFAGVGTLFSSMTVHARARELLLPVLLFPVVIPVLIAAVQLTAGLVDGQAWSEMSFWLQLLVAFDVIFLGLSYVLFEYTVEE